MTESDSTSNSPASRGHVFSAGLYRPRREPRRGRAFVHQAHGFAAVRSIVSTASPVLLAGLALLSSYMICGFGALATVGLLHSLDPGRQIADWRRAISYLESRRCGMALA